MTDSPAWDAPYPTGYPSAVDSAATIVAPLLAGFSFALIGLIVQDPGALRVPGLALSLLMLAGLSFIAAVQCGFWAKQWVVTPSEMKEWRSDKDDRWWRNEQRRHRAVFRLWARRLRRTYRFGILLLLAGVSTTLVPSTDMTSWNIAAVAIAGAGFVLELCWMTAGWILHGSPLVVYVGQDDVPKEGTRFPSIREDPALRWIARRFEPLVQVEPRP